VTSLWQVSLENALLFLVLVNPASKVALLVALREDNGPAELVRAARRGSAVALGLLVTFAWVGSWTLRYVFHVELYALEVAAGAVLFLVGLAALKEGVFFESSRQRSLLDISIVPLASPLIAGPATISAAITQAQRLGAPMVSLAIVAALLVNLLVMWAGIRLAMPLIRTQVLGPLVRILGLFIAAIGANMVLGGVAKWLGSLPG